MTATQDIVEVTNLRVRKYPDKYIAGARVYVSSEITDVVDNFFFENEICSLKFKCRTWNALKKKATGMNIEALKTIFGEKASIKYSSKAGCSCGCSPGYVVKGDIPRQYYNSDVWVKNHTSADEIKKLLPEFQKRLDKELAEAEQ